MSDPLYDLIQQVLDSGDSGRARLGRSAASDLLNSLQNNYGFSRDDAFGFAFNVVKLFCCGDKVIQRKECELFNDIFGTNISYDDFFEATKQGTHSDFIQSMDNLIDRLDDDTKYAACTLGLCIVCSDGTATSEEKALLYKILG